MLPEIEGVLTAGDVRALEMPGLGLTPMQIMHYVH